MRNICEAELRPNKCLSLLLRNLGPQTLRTQLLHNFDIFVFSLGIRERLFLMFGARTSRIGPGGNPPRLCRKSSMLEIWAAPAAPKNHSKRLGAQPPTFWLGLWGRRGPPRPQTNSGFLAGPNNRYQTPKCTYNNNSDVLGANLPDQAWGETLLWLSHPQGRRSR